MEFRIKLTSHVRNFRQILMEHSYLMYKLVISRNSSKLKEMMNIWVEINSLTDEWAYKITCKNNDIGKEIRELIMSYSDVMCNVIIDRHVDEKKIENIIKLEAKFLSVIGKTSTISEWIAYTVDLIEMFKNPKKTYCFESAEVLGKTMDTIFYHQSNQLKGP